MAIPHSDVVHKPKPTSPSVRDGAAVEDVLLQELKDRPTDVQLLVGF